MNLLVRLDINKKIGTGHFRRMLNLANYMSMNKFLFLINTDTENNIIFKDLDIFFTNKVEELKDFKKIVFEHNIDIIILDMLHYEKYYIKNIKLSLNKKIISFHEYDDLSDYSDLKINYNFFDNYQKNQKRDFLAGPKYIIFDDKISKIPIRINVKDYILVSFGGSDPSSLTEHFIKNIATKLLEVKFYIHIGHFNILDFNCLKITKNITLLEQPSNLLEYMSSAKYAITAAGNMMYELIYLKVPTLVIAHNQHQEEFAKNADKCKCIEYYGLSTNIDFLKLKRRILQMCDKDNEIINNNKCIIDELGLKRITIAIMEELK